MTLQPRVLLLLLLLATCSGLQAMAVQHVNPELMRRDLPLNAALADFPNVVTGWVGRDEPITSEEFLYGDEHLNRIYVAPNQLASATVWMGYSSLGRDRCHNPEVCMLAHGFRERPEDRSHVELEDGMQAIRKYRFARPDGRGDQWVYYWHYSRQVADVQRLTLLQKLRWESTPAASLTVEVFAPVGQPSIDEFVRELEAEIRRQLPDRTVRGSRLRPVYLVNDGGVLSE